MSERLPEVVRPGASHARSDSTTTLTVAKAYLPTDPTSTLVPRPVLFPLRISDGDLQSRARSHVRRSSQAVDEGHQGLPVSVLRQGVPLSSVGVPSGTGRRAWRARGHDGTDDEEDDDDALPTALPSTSFTTSATTFDSDDQLLTALPKSGSTSIDVGQLSIMTTPRSTVPEAEDAKAQAEMIVGIPRRPSQLHRRVKLQQQQVQRGHAAGGASDGQLSSSSPYTPLSSSMTTAASSSSCSSANDWSPTTGSLPTPISAPPAASSASVRSAGGGQLLSAIESQPPRKGLKSVMDVEELKARRKWR